jgi:REP element-mobilizing transposase RayT
MYHVTLRGNHRQDIFFNVRHRTLLSELIAEVLMRSGARLHAYCFMPNHVHALIQVADVPLGKVVQPIASRYARTIQAAMHTTGHLFEKRYHPVLVDIDAYLLELLRYIHLNPVRARLVARPEDYAWSSHHTYLGCRTEPWVTTDVALALFHLERARAVEAYRQFVHEQVGRAHGSPLDKCNPNDRRVLGSDSFAVRMLGQAWQPRSSKRLEQIIEEACDTFRVSVDQLASASRAPQLVRARAWVAREAVGNRVATITAVARRLNRVESSLMHCIARYFPGP